MRGWGDRTDEGENIYPEPSSSGIRDRLDAWGDQLRWSHEDGLCFQKRVSVCIGTLCMQAWYYPK